MVAQSAQAACDAQQSKALEGVMRPAIAEVDACAGLPSLDRTERVELRRAYYCPGATSSRVKASIAVMCGKNPLGAEPWASTQTFELNAIVTNVDCRIRKFSFRTRGVPDENVETRASFSRAVLSVFQRELARKCR